MMVPFMDDISTTDYSRRVLKDIGSSRDTGFKKKSCNHSFISGKLSIIDTYLHNCTFSL